MSTRHAKVKLMKMCQCDEHETVKIATCNVWNAKLTETRIFRELSIELKSSLIELKSSLIQLKSSFNSIRELFNSIRELSKYTSFC